MPQCEVLRTVMLAYNEHTMLAYSVWVSFQEKTSIVALDLKDASNKFGYKHLMPLLMDMNADPSLVHG